MIRRFRNASIVIALACIACGFAHSVRADATTKPTTSPSGASVSDADQISFQQTNVAAQMQELQERMFRLAELTRDLEPDDSAKLIMAVRRAREELIVEQMKEVLEMIGQKDLGKASSSEQQVLVKLEELKKLLTAADLDLAAQLEQLRKLQASIKKLDEAIKEQKRQRDASGQLAQLEKKGQPLEPKKLDGAKLDQQQNRKATEAVNKTVGELGAMGQKAGQSLGNATGSMSKAEGALGAGKGSDAEVQQTDAVKQMQIARDELEQQRQKLQQQIESQVRKQVITNLTEMLDRQKVIRESTQRLSASALSGQRDAALAVKRLGVAEGHIVTICDQTLNLINETQFSIALPPALQSIQRRCIFVQNDLNQSRADDNVVAAEKKIERDLTDLIETFKELASSKPGSGQCKGCKGDKNKLLAELKVLRMLQVRVNEETLDVDGSRAKAEAELLPELRKKIGEVRDHQQTAQDTADEIHHKICPDCLQPD